MKSPVAMAQSGGLYPASLARPKPSGRTARQSAFTLVEVLVATAITLLLMAGIVTLFAAVSESVSRGQAMMETGDRLRATQHRVQTDLKYLTAPMQPWLDPRENGGHTTIVESPEPYDANYPAVTGIEPQNSENGGLDSTVGDRDMLMFTARSYGEPFVGRWDVGGAIQSQVAEICWFMRGTTLYRRVLLVVPERTIPTAWYNGLYYYADVSAHQEGGPTEPNLGWGNAANDVRLVPNSLGDLTKRENRYGHWPRYVDPNNPNNTPLQGFPHDVRIWGQGQFGQLGLPTLRESSGLNDAGNPWPFPLFPTNGTGAPTNPTATIAPVTQNDFWVTPYPWANVDGEMGTLSDYVDAAGVGNRPAERVAEDVILNNVLSFDVKVWDPYAPVLLDAANQVLEPGDPGYRLALQPIAGAIQTWVNGGRQPNAMPPQILRLGAYVDLYYTRGIPAAEYISSFSHAGDLRSGLRAGVNMPAIWDTYPSHYEHDGVDQDGDGLVDEGTDGLNNDPSVNRTLNKASGAMVVENGLPNPPGINGSVDDDQERETAPPYDAPIRSIQIKVRVFERDSRQIREVTVTQDFVP
jgi:type II secretory pathway pseudopilin PulG